MTFNKIKKLGLMAGIVAVLGATGVLNKIEYEINDLSYDMFQVSPIGSESEYRAESIMHDFENTLKGKNLTTEAQLEVAQLKKVILSDEYKENLKDKKFYDNERFFGVGNLESIIGHTETPLQEFNEQLKKTGWDVSNEKANNLKVVKAGIVLTDSESNVSESSEQKKATYGFFNQEIGLQSYVQERRMAEPFKPFSSLEAKGNIEKVRSKATELRKASQSKTIKS